MPNFLPEEYLFSHDYCYFLHDYLVTLIKVGEQNGKFDQKINFKESELPKQFVELDGEDLYNWLRKNYKEEADKLTIKQIFAATLSDFCHFIHTALMCSNKGKLSVTFSLLRKPLKDNLLILEWLLSYPDDLLEKFNSANSFNEVAIEKIPKEKKIMMIKRVSELINYPSLEPEFIYELRYDKHAPFGFEPLWQKATHIVTSFKQYRTEEGNLNFIFSGFEDKVMQWDQLYFLLPGLLLYIVQLCAVAYRVHIDENWIINRYFLDRLIVGFMLLSKQKMPDLDLECFIDDDILALHCNYCGEKQILTNSMCKAIYKTELIICNNCGQEIFFFDLSILDNCEENTSLNTK